MRTTTTGADGPPLPRLAVRVRPLSDYERSRMPAELKVSAFSALGGEGSLAGSGTPRKEVAIGAGHAGRGWSRIVSEYTDKGDTSGDSDVWCAY